MRCNAAARCAVFFFALAFFINSYGQLNDTVSVQTADLTVRLTRGAITGITNNLTNESYLDSSAVEHGVGLLQTGNQSLLANNAMRIVTTSIGDTIRTVFYSALNDSFATSVRGDQNSGQILLRQKGKLALFTGVYGARFCFADFDLRKGKLILPVAGGISIDENSRILQKSWDYLTNWQTQLVIFEGTSGSLGIWFDDSLYTAKRISLKRNGYRVKLYLEVHNAGDFKQRHGIATPVLHLQAFSGDWRQPAAAYRQWMLTNLHPLPLAEKPAWIDSIGLIVIHRNLQTQPLDSLAKLIDPHQVLVYIPNWRQAGYDVNYPDYTPLPEAAPYIQYAHQLGFRVMIHVNPFGIAPYNELYSQFAPYQLRHPFSGELLGWRWNTNQPVRHAFIHPANRALQDLFLQKMRDTKDALNMDAVHLDVDFGAWNSDHAILNGENPAQGNRTFHKRLADAFPDIVWGGENLTEVNFYRDTFAQRWKTDVLNWSPHPISTFLFSRTTLPVGYLGVVNPDRDPDLYNEFTACYEPWGVLPTLEVNDVSDLYGNRSQELVRIAKAWGRLGLKADFDSQWDEDTIFRLAGRNGERAEYRRTSFGSTFIVDGDSLYRKVTGVDRFSTTKSIRGWFAYNDSAIFGLNPSAIFWLDENPPDLQYPHLHALSPDVIVNHVSLSTTGGHFSLLSNAIGNKIDLVDKLPEAEMATRKNGALQPIGDGAFVNSATITLGGITKKGFETHPPYLNGPGDVLITYSLTLPDSPRIDLAFSAGMDEGALNTDGVNFFVEINGTRIYTTYVVGKTWTDLTVDLSEWRGQTIALTLGNDPGPPGSTTDYDWARWGDVVIDTVPHPPFTAQLFLPFSASISGGSVLDVGAHFYEIKGRLPAELTFAENGQTVALPYNILENFSGHIGTTHSGLFFLDNRPWGAGNIRNVSCGGVSKMAISGHPPAKGSTVIQNILTLPAETPLKLSGSYGIADGALTSGVYFSVSVNGINLLHRFTDKVQWSDFEIDLSPFAGKSILLELITSPGMDNYWDWANWAELQVSRGVVGTVFDNDVLPKSFHVSRPYPNPFNSEVEMTLHVPRKGCGEFSVYNITGQKVFAKPISFPAAGTYTVHWNSKNVPGNAVSSGIYFMYISFGEKVWVRKTLLLR